MVAAVHSRAGRMAYGPALTHSSCHRVHRNCELQRPSCVTMLVFPDNDDIVELGCKRTKLLRAEWINRGFLYRVRHIFGACPAFCHYYSNSASRCFPRCFPVLPGASRSSRRASRWRGGAACFIRRRMRRMQPWRIVPRRSMRGSDRAGGPGRFFKIYIFDDCQIIENNNIKTGIFGQPEAKVHLGRAWRIEFPYRNIRES